MFLEYVFIQYDEIHNGTSRKVGQYGIIQHMLRPSQS